jgi:hypothetical protein
MIWVARADLPWPTRPGEHIRRFSSRRSQIDRRNVNSCSSSSTGPVNESHMAVQRSLSLQVDDEGVGKVKCSIWYWGSQKTSNIILAVRRPREPGREVDGGSERPADRRIGQRRQPVGMEWKTACGRIVNGRARHCRDPLDIRKSGRADGISTRCQPSSWISGNHGGMTGYLRGPENSVVKSAPVDNRKSIVLSGT